METHEAVAHFALDLGAGHQRCHGVHHHHIDGAAAHQRLGDLQRLLAGIRLGDQHILHIDAQRLGVGGIQRVLGVHKGHLTALLLGLRQHMEGQRSLAGGFRAVDLHYTAPGQAPDPQRQIQRQRAGGDRLHIGHVAVTITHDRALAIHLLNLLHGGLDRLFLVGVDGGRRRFLLRCHGVSSFYLSVIQLSNTLSWSVPYTTRGIPAVSGTISISPKPCPRMIRSTASA